MAGMKKPDEAVTEFARLLCEMSQTVSALAQMVANVYVGGNVEVWNGRGWVPAVVNRYTDADGFEVTAGNSTYNVEPRHVRPKARAG